MQIRNGWLRSCARRDHGAGVHDEGFTGSLEPFLDRARNRGVSQRRRAGVRFAGVLRVCSGRFSALPLSIIDLCIFISYVLITLLHHVTFFLLYLHVRTK